MKSTPLENKAFLLLLIIVSVAFVWILLPYYGAVFWGAILAILFAPMQRWFLRRFNQRRNLAALSSLGVCLLLVILPITLITLSLIQEGSALYERINSGQLNFGEYFQHMWDSLPNSFKSVLHRFDITDPESIRQRLTEGAAQGSQVMAGRVLSFGQGTFQFFISFGIMLYLLFFLLRDGQELVAIIRKAIPLSEIHKRSLLRKFTAVIRATVKGNIIVAVIQGTLGGFILGVLGVEGAVLWGVVMAFLSLLPAIGAGLIWGPVAIYFLATGALWQGIVLILFGVVVIGLVDNILRPILVGKDTKLPDYVVLISTLGGMAMFGLNGFVIGPLVAALFMSVWDLFSHREDM
ncbi:putative PurR-regulated permease PerM [Pseudomonas duriflava]|uniref:Putative PurR-regulated permease PerM n=1 Tax=Pseudomonas duriflava TaxID=459528 RepID=A0A562Q8Q7_9PSED|nr:AI-2E family transporter [Pseudomonas duriflava]TWI53113.1 putative PurR-regulated permease PerM [Pseudomonas duriflava]